MIPFPSASVVQQLWFWIQLPHFARVLTCFSVEECAAYQNSLRGRDSSLEFSSVVVANKKGERVGVAAKEVKSIDVAEPSLPRF